MATRSTRKQPFCWQEKKVLRLLRAKYDKSELVKMKVLYLTITEIDSDFNGKPIKYYTKTIAKYSGLSRDWIPSALRKLEELGVVKIVENRNDKAHVIGRELIFTPDNILPQKPDTGKPDTRKPVIGKSDTLEDSFVLEDSFSDEDIKRIVKNTSKKGSNFENFWSKIPTEMRKAKKKSRELFEKAIKAGVDESEMIDAIETQKQERRLKIENGLWVPEWKNCATWLRNECWTDAVLTEDEIRAEHNRRNGVSADAAEPLIF